VTTPRRIRNRLSKPNRSRLNGIRSTGGRKVAGSNPVAPITENRSDRRAHRRSWLLERVLCWGAPWCEDFPDATQTHGSPESRRTYSSEAGAGGSMARAIERLRGARAQCSRAWLTNAGVGFLEVTAKTAASCSRSVLRDSEECRGRACGVLGRSSPLSRSRRPSPQPTSSSRSAGASASRIARRAKLCITTRPAGQAIEG
jgi:hypothetical protein